MKKTWFGLQMAICIASGKPFIGFNVVKARRVLFIQLEVPQNHFHRRFRMVARGQLKPEKDYLGFINGRGLEPNEQMIIKAAKSMNAEVIFIDPLYKILKGDENTAHGIRDTLAMFDRITMQTEATLVYSHHDTKGHAGHKDIRDRGAGSNIIGRDYDVGITLTPHTKPDLQVVDVLLRNYPMLPSLSITWKEGLFSRVETAPVVQSARSSNFKPSTQNPDSNYFNDLRELVGKEPGIMKTTLVSQLRDRCDLTKIKAGSVIDAAVQQGIVFSNMGKGLPHKKIIYALNEKELSPIIINLRS